MAELEPGEEPHKERRRRASRPKVRTGCLTCKYGFPTLFWVILLHSQTDTNNSDRRRIRHKKCDEAHPFCFMCTSTGRKCEYRETSDRRTRASRVADKAVRLEGKASGVTQPDKAFLFGPLVPLVHTGQVDLTPDERWYLDYFRNSTSIQAAGYFYDEFWQRLVHQASDNQPAVRHAVISMGALNWEFIQLRIGENRRSLDRAVSLQQCNKAIACLRQNLRDDRMGRLRVEIALITCVVLVNVILFQESVHLAGRHLRSGYKLLEQYLSDNAGKDLVGPILRQAFSASHLVWSSFANPAAFTEDNDSTFQPLVPNTFSEPAHNPEKASDFMTTLARLVIQSNSRGFSAGPTTPDLDGEPFVVLTKLRAWRSQIKGALVLHKERMSQRDLEALTIFELWSEILRIMLVVETQPAPRELKYDDFVGTFQKAIQIAKAFLASRSGQSPMPTFWVRKGVIPPLFFCAFRCRDWFVRREALTLLRQWCPQEAISTTWATVLVLKRVIELESAGLTSGDVVPESSRIESVIVEMPSNTSQLHLKYRRTRSPEMTPMIQTDSMRWESEWLPYQVGQTVI